MFVDVINNSKRGVPVNRKNRSVYECMEHHLQDNPDDPNSKILEIKRLNGCYHNIKFNMDDDIEIYERNSEGQNSNTIFKN